MEVLQKTHKNLFQFQYISNLFETSVYKGIWCRSMILVRAIARLHPLDLPLELLKNKKTYFSLERRLSMNRIQNFILCEIMSKKFFIQFQNLYYECKQVLTQKQELEQELIEKVHKLQMEKQNLLESNAQLQRGIASVELEKQMAEKSAGNSEKDRCALLKTLDKVR